MNFVVLLKQVPDVANIPPDAWDREKGTLRRAVLDNILNPLDLHALTLATRIRDQLGGGKIVCVSMGIPTAYDILLDAMARGADEAVLLTDGQFAGADTIATARSIELAVRRIEQVFFGGDRNYIALAGMQSTDGDTAQVPAQLAQALSVDLIAYATGAHVNGDVQFQRIGPTGMETVRAGRLPVMVTVTDCTEPAYPSFTRARAIRRRSQPYQVWTAKDVGADPADVGAKGSRTQVVRIFSPKRVQKDCHLVKEPAELLPLLQARLAEKTADAAAAAGPAYSLAGKEPSYRGELWTLAEVQDGRLAPVTGELIGKARELAATLNEKVGVVLPGAGVRGLIPELIQLGADTVYVADDSRLAHYHSIPYSHVVAELVKAHRPQIMLFGASPLGRELAPRVAYAAASGLTADCTQLDIGDHAGKTAILLQTRPALGGNIMATIVAKSSATQMATVRPGVFSARPPDPARTGAVVEYAGAIPEGTVEVLTVAPVQKKAQFAGAEIIVAGGAGLRTAENFNKWLPPLAAGLQQRLGRKAVTGATRRAVEADFVTREQQVGQTGQTVEPQLYVAVGISGAVQHVSGMHKSKVVVAINADPKAPIFRVADFGVVGKAEKIVPALIEALQQP